MNFGIGMIEILISWSSEVVQKWYCIKDFRCWLFKYFAKTHHNIFGILILYGDAPLECSCKVYVNCYDEVQRMLHKTSESKIFISGQSDKSCKQE